MKKLTLLALVGTVALSSCNQAPDVSGKSVSKAFTDMKLSGYTTPSGTAKYVDLNSGDRVTTLTLSGLKANTNYLSHYHKMGTASTDPCKSGGEIVGGVLGTGTSDANGKLTIKGLQSTADLKDAKYINVHEASALANVPVCAPL
ncbi:hypothetical protein [Deinococcus sp.]|uniref:hypothetical protein n=1 Tax=Deinococcus sp. TaxID=47478 RepID=UPI0025C0E24C|nr:hypothetical protein [Deinococcus sp.]